MPSHAAVQVLAEKRASPGRTEALLRLACGCQIAAVLTDDRLLDGAAGARLAVGKFPCPARHPVGHKPAAGPAT